MHRNFREWKSTRLSVAVIVLIQALYLALWLWLLPIIKGAALLMVVVVLLAILNLCTIAGLVLALRQRIKEWKGGEEHDAGQY